MTGKGIPWLTGTLYKFGIKQTHLMFNLKQSIIIYDFAIYSTKRKMMMRERESMQWWIFEMRNCSGSGSKSWLTIWLSVSQTTCICTLSTHHFILRLVWPSFKMMCNPMSLTLSLLLSHIFSRSHFVPIHLMIHSVTWLFINSFLIWTERQKHSVRDLSVCVVCTCQVWCCRYKTTITFSLARISLHFNRLMQLTAIHVYTDSHKARCRARYMYKVNRKEE